MRYSRRQVLESVAGAAAFQVGSKKVQADDYPSRPITIVVPFPAGGPTDTLARILADRMTAFLGQSVIIEDVSGAGGSVGLGRVAHATPDGYTLSIGHWGTHVVIAATMKLPFDVVNDFEPIALLSETPIWLVGRADLPAKNLAELITWLKQKPEEALAGAVGVGGASDLNAAYFESVTGTKLRLVPYLGAAPLNQDLIAGRVDLFLGMAAATFPFVRAGQMKAYAVMAKARWWAAPEVPTMEEEGVPGLYASFWHGLWAPKGMPTAIIARLNSAVRAALADPAVQKRYADQGQTIPSPDRQSPEVLGKLQKDEIEKWWPIIKNAGIKAG